MPQFEKAHTTKGCFTKHNRTYQEIIQYLNAHWSKSNPKTMHTINALLGNIAQTIPTIIISGTTGKSTTITYLSQIFQTKKIRVGTWTSPQPTHYNERFSVNGTFISNEIFTELANTILNLLETHQVEASSKEILIALSLLYFKQENVEVALLEQSDYIDYDPITIYQPKIVAITRIVGNSIEQTQCIQQGILQHVQPRTYVVAADQSKIMLQNLGTQVKEKGGCWTMPIRKLAPLPYPYEQLHGRCAALAERIAQTFITNILKKNPAESTICTPPKKQRGRPRLQSQKTNRETTTSIETFWQTIQPFRLTSFQIKYNKKNTIVIDNAYTLDALQNLFLGIRLLNYKKSFKKICFIFGYQHEQINTYSFIKALRYFVKKTPAHIIFCPVPTTVGEQAGPSWNTKKMVLEMQKAKIKATSSLSFEKAYHTCLQQLTEAQDLLVIAGSQAIINQYQKITKG